ncbi:thiol reductant ABC exporter subunit CydD [Verticiella sediminum]|uniref:thiol reductant ABC exporter subunit CydD n=1 Tax=Verticiella sediminum TaxID=1247510 RepID=UPI001FE3116C|nr:thiol reductant ABC exporter subunit CydD [Verticiella sediminum]
MSIPSASFGIALQTFAALLWLPQAALLAWVAQRLAAGQAGLDWLALIGGSFLVLALARAAADAWGVRLSYARARAQVGERRRAGLRALAGASPFDARRVAAGAAASALAEQAEAITPYLTRYRAARVKVQVVPLALAAAVACVSWLAALILVFTAPLIPIFMALVGWRAQAASEAHLRELGSLNAYVLDRLRGLASLRGLGALAYTRRRLRALSQSLRIRTMAVLRIAFLSSAVLELFSALGVALVAVYVGFHLLGQLPFGAWGASLSLGQGVFVLLLAPAFFEPLRELASVWHDRAAGEAGEAALAALGREVLPLPGGASAAAPAAGARVPPEVRLDAVSFAYPGHASAPLREFSLELAAGGHLAITGDSGAGKSTLLALVAGLLAPDSGRVLIQGETLHGANAARLRARMAWVGQRPHFFAATLGGNVRLGRPGVDAAAVRRALGLAHLDLVAERRGAARLGEGAAGLSGGEAVRLAIARAAADPACDLILADEPTAHLDRATADAVIDSLLALGEGRTLLVATHDPRLVARLGCSVELADPAPRAEAA